MDRVVEVSLYIANISCDEIPGYAKLGYELSRFSAKEIHFMTCLFVIVESQIILSEHKSMTSLILLAFFHQGLEYM